MVTTHTAWHAAASVAMKQQLCQHADAALPWLPIPCGMTRSTGNPKEESRTAKDMQIAAGAGVCVRGRPQGQEGRADPVHQ